jgi:hypothetical protein
MSRPFHFVGSPSKGDATPDVHNAIVHALKDATEAGYWRGAARSGGDHGGRVGPVLHPGKGRQGHPICYRLDAPRSPAGAFGSPVHWRAPPCPHAPQSPLRSSKDVKAILLCGGRADVAAPGSTLVCTPIPPPSIVFQLTTIDQSIFSAICVFFAGLALRNYFKLK